MKEKEKCRQGLLYNANYDQELLYERTVCKNLCQEYSQTPYSDVEKRNTLLRKILVSVEGSFIIEPPFWCDYGYNIEFGDNFFSNHNLVILDAAQVRFGANVFIGPNCGFYTSGHPEIIKQRNEGLEYARPILVGDNVWFGGNVVTLPGVSIGNNSIVGSGSVVTKDIPSNVIAAGNPCKVLRAVANQY